MSGWHSWEICSWKLDQEEPGAAQVIAIALNKRNEVAMKTGHLEIMATLVSRCKSDPGGTVLFNPVGDKVIDLYGDAVDHPNFVDAFKFVLAAGGAGNPHMKGLADFTSVFVNPRTHQINFDVYSVVAQYPEEFRKLKNACVKWSWKRTGANGGRCPVPPNISHIMAKDGKASWY